MNYLKRMVAAILMLTLIFTLLPMTASAKEEKLLYGAGHVITSKLRLYERANSDSEVLDIASCGECVVVIRKSSTDGWYRVNYNMQEGYMRADCLYVDTEMQTELGYGEINESIVYLRSGPGTEYSIVRSGFQGKEYYILGVDDGWYQILDKNATCYVRSDLMDLTEIPYENEGAAEEPQFFTRGETIAEITYEETEPVAMAESGGYYAPISGSGILGRAQKFIGTPYVFGGASPEGFDCSGLVFYVLSEMGYSSYRTAADQYKMGSSVKKSDLRAGDLVFFANTYQSGISHVGIYAGGGKFLHAPKEGSTVSYSSLSGYWADHYHGARRLG